MLDDFSWRCTAMMAEKGMGFSPSDRKHAGALLALIITEIAEAMDAIKKGRATDAEEEMADALIRAGHWMGQTDMRTEQVELILQSRYDSFQDVGRVGAQRYSYRTPNTPWGAINMLGRVAASWGQVHQAYSTEGPVTTPFLVAFIETAAAAVALGVTDLDGVIREKMAVNAGRPYRFGLWDAEATDATQ